LCIFGFNPSFFGLLHVKPKCGTGKYTVPRTLNFKTGSPHIDLAVCQNLVPLVNIKIAGKWMFIPLKMVLIGIDPYPSESCLGEAKKFNTDLPG